MGKYKIGQEFYYETTSGQRRNAKLIGQKDGFIFIENNLGEKYKVDENYIGKTIFEREEPKKKKSVNKENKRNCRNNGSRKSARNKSTLRNNEVVKRRDKMTKREREITYTRSVGGTAYSVLDKPLQREDDW